MKFENKAIAFLCLSIFILSAAACAHQPVYLSEGIYYVDAVSGDDDSDGLSPDTAWKSLNKLSYSIVAPGSEVLFKSGVIFRGSLYPSSGSIDRPIRYGTYGGDDKALLQNSVDLSSPSSWRESESGVWKATVSFDTDVGNLIFNGNDCAARKWDRTELQSQNDYFFDRFWKTLRLKSSVNPADAYFSIEAALSDHVINQSNVTYAEFENLHIRYGGAHGFGGGGTAGLHIHDCEFSYLGGGFLYEKNGEPVRFGNGVEFWGDASDNIVENCYFHDIYDTGVTNQNHTTSAIQKNITYRNNIIENCALASFEFWNRPEASTMTNIVFENNTSIDPGSGWGAQRPDIHGSHISVFGNQSELKDIVIRNNIFYGGNMIFFFDQATFDSSEVSAEYNCLYPVEDGDYDYLCIVWDDKSIETSVKYETGELSSLRTDSGREAGSISVDPQFKVIDFPYDLSDGSPCSGWGAEGF